MGEKTKKDYKIKDKKISVKSSICYYIAGICFILTGLISIFMEKNLPMGLLYVSLGGLFVSLGANAAEKEKKEANNHDNG